MTIALSHEITNVHADDKISETIATYQLVKSCFLQQQNYLVLSVTPALEWLTSRKSYYLWQCLNYDRHITQL